MKKTNINEELERMLYLSGHKRGVVISEQSKIDEQLFKKLKNWFKSRKQRKGEVAVSSKQKSKNKKYSVKTNTPNWNGGLEGTIDFTSDQPTNFNIVYIARNLTTDNYSLSVSYITPPVIEREFKPYTFSPFELKGKNMPYHDNMVNPDFDDPNHKNAKDLYEKFIMNVVNFINKGGFDKIKSLTIVGEADSAAPTRSSPTGNIQDLVNDHSTVTCTTNGPLNDGLFCGLTDKSQMNTWLATFRADRFGARIVKDVKEKTGVDISSKIVMGTPISHYNPNADDATNQRLRGEEYRKIVLTPEADVLYVPEFQEGVDDGSLGIKQDEVIYDFNGKKIPVKLVNIGRIKKYEVRPDIIKKYNLLDSSVIDQKGPGTFNGSPTHSGSVEESSDGTIQNITVGSYRYPVIKNEYQTSSTTEPDAISTPFVSRRTPILETSKDGKNYLSLFRFTFDRSGPSDNTGTGR